MKFNEDIINIIFLARGGQGAKTATEILAQTAVAEGKFVKAFPDFGPERSGAPIKTYLRISGQEIRTSEPITNPDVVVVLDETVLESEKFISNLNFGNGVMIVNSGKNPKEVGLMVSKFKGKIYAIDASGLAMRIIGKPTPNIAILGYLNKILELVKISDIIRVFEMIFMEKLGKEMTEKNIQALEEAYDML
jgi:pyruvate ferredoxin oxidoreductase gamma subunit